MRAATHLRYELLPYLYSLAYENSLTGAPLVRTMDYEEDLPLFQPRFVYTGKESVEQEPINIKLPPKSPTTNAQRPVLPRPQLTGSSCATAQPAPPQLSPARRLGLD